MARLVSLIIAVVCALAGHALAFLAGFYLERSIATGGGSALPVFVLPLLIVGVVLIGVVALTAAWSSTGVVVVGGVGVVLGLFGAFFPPGVGGSPRTLLSRALFALGPLGQIADLWLAIGAGVLEGALLLVVGWAAARRRRGAGGSPAASRVVSVVVVFVALGPAMLLALQGGYLDYQRAFQLLAGPSILGLVLALLGILLLAGVMATVRWSGLGAIVWGGLLLLVSFLLAGFPVLLGVVGTSHLPAALFGMIFLVVAVGAPAVIGALFLGGGIAAARAGHVGRRRASFVAASSGGAAEVAPPPTV